MAQETIKVMIVDDHPMVRKGLAMFVSFNKDMELVGEANNAATAIEMYNRERPDVVLMDLVMPEVDGTEITRRIRQEDPDAAIIALTSFVDEELIESALRAGARGFLYKNISVEELSDAIRQTHRGRTILDPKASDVMMRLLGEATDASLPSLRANLSEREHDVLRLLVLGLTNKQIAAKLDLQPSTVKQYISNLLSKLNVQSRTEAVALALKLDLVEK